MTAQIKSTQAKLKVHCQTQEDGVKKTRIITINNINPMADNDNLYSLAEKLSGLVEDTMSKVVRAKDEILEQI